MSIDSIENPPSEVVPNEGEESHPLEESCEVVEQNFEDHPSSICSKDNPFIKNALNSLTPEQARNYKKIGEQIFRSGITFEGMDSEELGLYLSLNRSNFYLKSLEIDTCCPYREETARGPKPRITSSGVETNKIKRFRLWEK